MFQLIHSRPLSPVALHDARQTEKLSDRIALRIEPDQDLLELLSRSGRIESDLRTRNPIAEPRRALHLRSRHKRGPYLKGSPAPLCQPSRRMRDQKVGRIAPSQTVAIQLDGRLHLPRPMQN